jgi:hypothetical protein
MAVEDRMDIAFGRNPDIAVEPSVGEPIQV